MARVVEWGEKWGIVGPNSPGTPENEVWVGRAVEHMFFGRYEHTIDSKGRLAIPSRHRPSLAAGLVITRGFEPCLLVYPISRWEQIAAKFDELPTMSQDDVSNFERYLFAEAVDCIPDKQGRVLIPSHLLEYAHLSETAIVAGVRDHLEVWNPETYGLKNADLEKDPKAFARGLSQYGIL